MIAEVLVDLKTNQILSSYDYLIPDTLEGFLKLGMRVIIPFGNTSRVGLIVGFKTVSKEATKTIIGPFDLEPVVTKEQLFLIEYLEKEAMIPKNIAYFKVLPNALQINYKKNITVLRRDLLNPPLKDILIEDVMPYDQDLLPYTSLIEKAKSLKHIEVTDIFEQKRQVKKVSLYQQTRVKPSTQKQQMLWDFLKEQKSIIEIIEAGFSKAMVKILIDSKSIKETKVEQFAITNNLELQDIKSLTTEQQNAIDSIEEKLLTYQRFLLKGVSASGKTEVFLQLCLKLKKIHKQVLIITIDEALIDQLSRYLSPFLKVSIIHKGLSNQAELDSHRATQTGYSDVLITTPTGIFTPFKQLGLIIADEAQDQIYLDYAKSMHGLDILVERAKFNKVPLIYATATPPVQLLYDATMGKLTLIELQEKVYQTQDKVIVVDMKKELLEGNLSIISKPLNEAISHALRQNKQALILANKSGYSSYVLCRSCGYVPTCPKCDLPLSYHKSKQQLRCHHCGFTQKEIEICPTCHSDKIRPVGIAIEQVEAALIKQYPKARIVRLDKDSTTSKGSYVKTISAFKDKQIDILVGTQMISKGHDFDIPVVGILLIDSMLKAPSYLANERTYQLIKQTMGRAGRKQNGISIIQTYQTNHFVMNALQDETAFYEQELNNRLLGNYPPYAQLLTILFKGEPAMIATQIHHLKQNILSRYSQYDVIGPAEYDQNTFKLMIKTSKRQDLSHLALWIKNTYEKPSVSIAFYRYDDEV